MITRAFRPRSRPGSRELSGRGAARVPGAQEAPPREDEGDPENDRRDELADELAVEEVEPRRAEREHEEDGAVDRRADRGGDGDPHAVGGASPQRRSDDVVDRLGDDEGDEARADDP